MPELLEKAIENYKYQGKPWKKIRFWCSDETRIGLKTITGKVITLKGIKPKGTQKWEYKYLWLYGLVEPNSGESFFYEFSNLDTICFEKFLEIFSENYPDDLHIIQVDNAGCHQSLNLTIPDNIILIFQPSPNPEINPIERLWLAIKQKLKWIIFADLSDLREFLDKILLNISHDFVASLIGWQFIIKALKKVGILKNFHWSAPTG